MKLQSKGYYVSNHHITAQYENIINIIDHAKSHSKKNYINIFGTVYHMIRNMHLIT